MDTVNSRRHACTECIGHWCFDAVDWVRNSFLPEGGISGTSSSAGRQPLRAEENELTDGSMLVTTRSTLFDGTNILVLSL